MLHRLLKHLHWFYFLGNLEWGNFNCLCHNITHSKSKTLATYFTAIIYIHHNMCATIVHSCWAETSKPWKNIVHLVAHFDPWNIWKFFYLETRYINYNLMKFCHIFLTRKPLEHKLLLCYVNKFVVKPNIWHACFVDID